MRITDIMLAEFTHEAAQTRKVLERVPADQKDWKPHEKSMTLGRLASHIADMPNWTPLTLNANELDLASGYNMAPFTTTEAMLAAYDANVEKAKAALRNFKDEDLATTWTLRNGEHVILAMPKGQCLRSMCFNHNVHHRGQLSVYLRLLGVPVPGMYGPSADEM
ncbi:MAG: DinB family protein [Gemmatimonadaceae bacterium]